MKIRNLLFCVCLLSTAVPLSLPAAFDEMPAPCDTACSAGKSWLSQIQTYGWLCSGITVNAHGTKNEYSADPAERFPLDRNMTVLSGNSMWLMKEHNSDYKVNQLWFGAAKKADGRCGLDFGFQADFLFGTDGKVAQSGLDRSFDYNWGSGDYYSSFAQLYAEAALGGFRVFAGKFAPPFGYEAFPQPYAFFYSHAYNVYNTPLTADGAVAEYKFSDKLLVQAGWTQGYMSSFGGRFKDNAFYGHSVWTPTRKDSLMYTVYYGQHNGLNRGAWAANFGRNYNNAAEFIQTLIYVRQLNAEWKYAVEGLYTYNEQFYTAAPDSDTRSWGIDQQLFYTVNPKWILALRAEYHYARGTLFGALGDAAAGGNIFEITFAVNWKPLPKLTVRPEIRYDTASYAGGFKPFNNGSSNSQLSGSISSVVMF